MTVLLQERPYSGDTDMLRWSRSFAGRTDEAPSARRFVAFLLDGHPCADDAAHVAAELVSNAIRHTRSSRAGGRFGVEVRRWPCGDVAVAVTDEGAASEPEPKDPGETEESGRGLRTVEALASRWHWTGGDGGRTVTATFKAH